MAVTPPSRPGWREQLGEAGSFLLGGGVLVSALAALVTILSGEFDLPARMLMAVGAGLIGAFLVVRRDLVLEIVTGRRARYGANAVVMSLALVGIVGLLNILSDRFHRRFDLTELAEFTLSSQTVQILESLQEPVHITGFFQEGDARSQDLEDLLLEYQQHTGLITFELIDPVLQPEAAIRLGISAFGTVVYQSGGREQHETGAIDERSITSALIKISREEANRVYFLTGHGERDMEGFARQGYGQIRQALLDEGYEVESLSLSTTPEVPEDASVVIVAAPQTRLLDQEAGALIAYGEMGGRLLVLQEPTAEATLEAILEPWGLAFEDDVIVDPEQALFGLDPFSPVVSDYPFHVVTRGLPDTVFTGVRSISERDEVPEGVLISSLIRTSEGSWGETDYTAPQVQPDEADLPGPRLISVAAEREATDEGPKARMVVFGDADFASNTSLTLGANQDLFLNAVNWLAEEEALVGIRPVPPASRSVLLTSVQSGLLFWTSVVFLPGAVVMAGVLVWWRRR